MCRNPTPRRGPTQRRRGVRPRVMAAQCSQRTAAAVRPVPTRRCARAYAAGASSGAGPRLAARRVAMIEAITPAPMMPAIASSETTWLTW